jgi:lipoic acid synthetase
MSEASRARLPAEFKQALRMNPARQLVGSTLDGLGLETVCRSAKCPNCNRCFSEGTATFLIMGPACTRRCTFCAVPKGQPKKLDPGEPQAVARAVAGLGLAYAVVTSVTRDDLPDGGAAHIAATVAAIRSASPGARVEVLIPDLQGDRSALALILETRPDVLNHNLETVPRLYPGVRPGADYRLSLGLLRAAAGSGLAAKSGLMVGLGEEFSEVVAVLEDLAGAGCRAATVGQYLAPSPGHRPITRFWQRKEFQALEERGRKLGMSVCAGPLVRSSYRAAELYDALTPRSESNISQHKERRA